MSGALHGVIASLAGRVTDTFWKYVSLLLNTSSTNGAQNNTFLDSSTNNFTVTRNGDTTQGSFNPYMPSGYWSGLFGSSNTSNIKIASNVAFGVGTGNFSVEFFLKLNAWSSTFQRYFIVGVSGTDGIVIGRDSAANNLLVNISASGSTNVITYAWTPNIGQWYHIALVRSGTGTNQVALYIDGVSVATGTSAASVAQNAVIIGGLDWATGYSAQGYISNVRFSNTARTITVPTSPYASDANTLVLACQDNRFKDNSTNAFAITVNGDTRISKFAPFNPPASYSTASYGGSGYFDGNGDQLNIANNAAFEIGSGDFCYEAWVYATRQTNTFAQGIINYGIALNTGSSTCDFQISNSGYLALAYATGASLTIVDTTLFPINQWVHAVACRTGSTISLFVNGARTATATTSATVGTGGAMVIGGEWYENAATRQLQGYISNARVIKGSHPYNATQTTLTVPTAPLTAIANTSLLLNFTNAGIYDAATINDGQTVGNAQVSTTQAKWGTTSMGFDGTGDWLVVPNRPELNIGTGDFTIECWINRTATASGAGNGDAIISKGTNNVVISMSVNTSKFEFGQYGVATLLTSTTVISNNTWYHVAITRSGTTLRMFINGTQEASTTSSANFTSTTNMFIGADANNTNQRINGYIQDLRITNGYARYTANFTPPTAAFPTL